METATERHELIFSPSEFNPTPVIIAGVGAGGSSICLSLAKLGVKEISIFDTQTVALPNVGPSIYGKKHVGMRKVDACAAIIGELSDDIEIKAFHRPIESARELRGVVFICVDDMDVRKRVLLKQCAIKGTKVQRVFEGRMGGTFGMSHSLNPRKKSDVHEWLRFWFPQRDAEPALPGCGARPVSFGPLASTIANFSVMQFVEWFAYKQKRLARASNQVRFDRETYQTEIHYW